MEQLIIAYRYYMTVKELYNNGNSAYQLELKRAEKILIKTYRENKHYIEQYIELNKMDKVG